MPAISGTCRRAATRPRACGSARPGTPLEHLTGGLGVPVQVGVHDGGPAAVAALDHVGDQDVPVQQRVPARLVR